jgi:hypothetical protein
MANVSTGPDGITVPGVGWTPQSTQYNSNKSLESYGSPSSSLYSAAIRQGYNAWSYDPALTQGSAPSISTTTIATLIYVPQNFNCQNVDWIEVTGTPNVTLALWPSTAPAGVATPLAWTAATAASAGAVNTLTWNGSSSPTSVTLIGGQSYFVTIYGSTTGTVSSMVTAQSYITNAAVSGLYSTSTVYRGATVGTLAGSITSASVFGTSTLAPELVWIGLH